jgi:arginyl-tRNA--protein-N-Asp/Glu arginylyltransferase
MRVLRTLTEPPRACSYLPEREAALEYRVMIDVTPTELESLLIRGWRRFGPIYFRPACSPCQECVSIRLPVAAFEPTDSQRRALRRIRRFRITLGRPRVDEERLALYRRWHATREAVRQWEPADLEPDEYAHQFAFPHPAVRELAIRDGDRLVGLGICDVTPSAWSAVYFFYDPSIARLSPGIANVMLCVEQAREAGIPYVYLGFRVMDCPSMRYKALFRPHELLAGRPAEDEEPRWLSAP